MRRISLLVCRAELILGINAKCYILESATISLALSEDVFYKAQTQHTEAVTRRVRLHSNVRGEDGQDLRRVESMRLGQRWID